MSSSELNDAETYEKWCQVLNILVFQLCLLFTFFSDTQSARIMMSIQFMYLIRFINVNLPNNLVYVLNDDKFTIKFFSKSQITEQINDLQQLKGQFKELQISPLLFNNIQEQVMQFSIALLLSISMFGLFKIINRINLSSQSHFINIFNIAAKKFIWQLPTIILLMNFVNISLFTWTNLIFQTFNKSINGMANYAFIIFLKNIELYGFYTIYKILEESNNLQKLQNYYYSNQFRQFRILEYKSNFTFLVNEFKNKQSGYSYYPLIELLKYELITLSLVVFPENAYKQLTVINLINAAFFIYLVTSKHFSKVQDQLHNICNEIFMVVITITLLFGYKIEQLDQFSNLAYGNLIIQFLISHKAFNIIILSLNLAFKIQQETKTFISQIKKQRNRIQQQEIN
eukprot:TRINITY_DN48903_c0_g1_i2.p1 TRINITY_DN48903_c0_g1~~TRINITY_DN48903_c0_g1_i2.p1  ORF type:complete len:399 (-),score=26.15 TRINITY_DN48903_c0_g1_i2:124-1320(-)